MASKAGLLAGARRWRIAASSLLLALGHLLLGGRSPAFNEAAGPRTAQRAGQLSFGQGPAAHAEISSYRALDDAAKRRVLDGLDEALQQDSCAALVSPDVEAAARAALGFWGWEFSEQMKRTPQSEWPAGQIGLSWPRAADMYTHPHYVAYLEPDGRSLPQDLPPPLVALLGCLRGEVLPVLEDLVGQRLQLPADSLAGQMAIVKAIVHYYPEPTRQEALLTHAAFHSDDSVLTLNFETSAGIHRLGSGDGGGLSIRRLTQQGPRYSAFNLFVGGYGQALSRGRWRSLIHSGSNPDHLARVSITLFLSVPALDGVAREVHDGTRSRQETAVYELLRGLAAGGGGGGGGSAAADAAGELARIRSMYHAVDDTEGR